MKTTTEQKIEKAIKEIVKMTDGPKGFLDAPDDRHICILLLNIIGDKKLKAAYKKYDRQWD